MVFPSMESPAEVISFALSKMPITNPNDLVSLLKTMENTLRTKKE